jgi:imidazolonepropionase-like amidohydrolase
MHRIALRFHQYVAAFWAGSPLQSGNWLRDSTPVHDSLDVLGIAQRSDMPILAGSDHTHHLSGFSLHAELAMLVAEGLTPVTALQAATINPAKFLRGTDSLGTIAAGKLADLVLLDANPLVDITNTTTIRAVVANGRYFDRGALNELLTEARSHGKTLP